MKSPGIEVRPIVSIDGMHHLNEVYFSDVRVPAENLVGEENKGWTYAKFLLENERGATAGTAATRAKLKAIRRMASAKTSFSDPVIERSSFAQRLSELEMRLDALEVTEARALTSEDGSIDAVQLSLPLKVIGTELQQDVEDLCVELVGYGAMPRIYERPLSHTGNEPTLFEQAPRYVETKLFGRATTIFGGTSEVQRNIMAKVLLQV